VILGLIELFVVGAVIVVCFGAYRVFRGPAATAGHDSAAPRCGRCNYIVRGVPTFTCPECGSDLREVGILTARSATRAAGPVPYIAIWTLVLLLIGIPLTAILVRVLPLWWHYSMQRYVFVQDRALNTTILATGARTGFGLESKFSAASPPKADSITLRIQNAPSRSDLVADPHSGAYCYTDASGAFVSRPTGFGPQSIRDWLIFNVPAAATADPATVLARATDIDTVVQELPAAQNRFTRLGRDATHPLDPVTAHPTFVIANPAPWNIALIIAAWLALWAYGVRRIRRRYAPALAVTPAPPSIAASAAA
jgi:hypothetical protein